MQFGDNPHSLSIQNIRLENFRIYKSKKFNIDGDLVIFVGSNGIGKTSIIEAIAILSNLKSFRGVHDKELIHHGSSQYMVELGYSNKSGLHKISMGFGNRSDDKKVERRMRFDGEAINKISEFIGKIQTVVFAPGDINILDSGPEERRRFIDIVLSSLHTDYLQSLQQYKKLLKFRSAYFHKSGNKFDEKYITALNIELIKYGLKIQNYRKTFIEEFQIIFSNYIHSISNDRDFWQIKYVPSINNGHEMKVYQDSIHEARLNDIRYKQTTRGIHRDRIQICNDKNKNMSENDISIVGSQGQKRTAVLALKMAQYEYTKVRTIEKPVLLIDDVLNELDLDRRKKFIDFLQDAGQAFITATDISALEEFIYLKKGSAKIQIFRVDENSNWIEQNYK
ncbi:MAG: DNA replication and repair protein RecF [Spirochaetia bacterium]|nr:DNA replication and repair protein RecF [Spirochaetia bacterium]